MLRGETCRGCEMKLLLRPQLVLSAFAVALVPLFHINITTI